jgi:hypothetical protein
MCFFAVPLFVTCRVECVTLLCMVDTLSAASVNGIATATTTIASKALFMTFFLLTFSMRAPGTQPR